MVAENDNVGVAMALVTGAGAATGIGGAVVFFPSLVRLASRRTLAAALGLSAGVMTYVSFAEIFIKSQVSFVEAGFTDDDSKIYSTLCFFAGVVCMIILNQFVTHLLGGHHHGGAVGGGGGAPKQTRNETSDPEQYQESSSSSDDTSVPPCPCHDDNPIGTLNKVQDMAESMAKHPDRAHPHGMNHHHHHHHHHDNKDDEEQQERAPGSAPIDQIEPVMVVQGQPGATGDDESSVGLRSATINPRAPPKSGASSSFGGTEFRDEQGTRSAALPEPVLDEDDDDDDSSDDEEEEDEEEVRERNKKLMRMSLNTALAIGLHNFPEGLATFVAALDDPAVGAVLAVAIAIHNIPEGLCVAMPIYYATGNRWKAFGWALLSGVAEPVAGLLGWAILAQSFSSQLYALLFGMVAGMMVIISMRELLPTAHRYDPEDTIVTNAFVVGMIIIAVSLLLFLI